MKTYLGLKVGDKVRHRLGGDIYTVISINRTPDGVHFGCSSKARVILNHELVMKTYLQVQQRNYHESQKGGLNRP